MGVLLAKCLQVGDPSGHVRLLMETIRLIVGGFLLGVSLLAFKGRVRQIEEVVDLRLGRGYVKWNRLS